MVLGDIKRLEESKRLKTVRGDANNMAKVVGGAENALLIKGSKYSIHLNY